MLALGVREKELMDKKEVYPNPDFTTLEEEDEYWQTHSQLEEGYEGEVVVRMPPKRQYKVDLGIKNIREG